MRKKTFRRSQKKKIGAPPGTLIHVGEQKEISVSINLIDYDAENLLEKEIRSVEECIESRDRPTVSWININGIHDVNTIESLGKCFDLHSLVLEDILNTEHRPKIEDYRDYIFCVLKMIQIAPDGKLHSEQVSIILGKTFVLSFQEREGDVFDGVRQRIRKKGGRIRRMGPDYLAYALLDSIVDSYYTVIERMDERIEAMEDELLLKPEPEDLEKLRLFQGDVNFLRRVTTPLPTLVSWLQRIETPLVTEDLGFFLRDVHDHAASISDSAENFRENVYGMFDLYVSSLNNRMNEVMKVLTVIATIFIPLTFIAGVYGMNFKYMPELEWRWSYPVLWAVMIGIVVGMSFYFKKKKWF